MKQLAVSKGLIYCVMKLLPKKIFSKWWTESFVLNLFILLNQIMAQLFYMEKKIGDKEKRSL